MSQIKIGSMVLLFLSFLAIPAWAHEGELTALQQAAGHMSGVNFLKTLGVLAIAGGLCFIFWGVIKTILQMQSLMEVLAWALAIGLTGGAFFLPDAYIHLESWIVSIGAIMFAVAIATTAGIRKLKPNERRFSGILMLLWGTIALVFESHFVGFLSVAALMSLLGFSIGVGPFSYFLGFEEDEEILTATFVGILVSFGYGAMTVLGMGDSPIAVFETGALYLGSFVAGVGFLISTSKWHAKKHTQYLANNLLACVFLFGGTFVSLLFGVQALSTMLIVFSHFYVAGKIIEVPVLGAVGFGVKLLLVGGFLFYAWNWLTNNPDFLAQLSVVS